MKAKRSLMAAALLSACLAAGGVAAHMGATGVVKERMESMKSLSASMKAIDAALKGNGELDRDRVAMYAQEISDHADRIVGQFPHGSGSAVSEASPEIWVRPDLFAQRAEALADAASDFTGITEDGSRDALTEAFRDIGKACSACHKDFRIKKQ